MAAEVAAGQGCGPPVTTWGRSRDAGALAACARASNGFAAVSVSSPRTVWTSDAIPVSSDGACWLTIAVRPLESAIRENEVENACDSSPAVAATGIESELALTGPGCRPWARSEDSTACTWSGAAPNRWTNSAGVM